ncbi:hypothetical protein B296_00004884 [Ensete ventricosum]|uniref:Uncharacterized protein n=1 Tax=Ensete ventricosum TaxID=4639 RepID=A0A426ZUI3_ENSVE|nr:hypothetical protein B296_00004884 [Ensete ventricosum]
MAHSRVGTYGDQDVIMYALETSKIYAWDITRGTVGVKLGNPHPPTTTPMCPRATALISLSPVTLPPQNEELLTALAFGIHDSRHAAVEVHLPFFVPFEIKIRGFDRLFLI